MKRRIIALVVVTFSILGLSSVMLFTFLARDLEKNKNLDTIIENKKTNDLDEMESIKMNVEELEKKENKEEKIIDKNSDDTSHKTTNENSTTSIPEQKVDNSIIVEEKENVIEKEEEKISETSNQDEIKENNSEQDDLELLEMKKIYRYKDRIKCYETSIEVAESDPINIRNTTCVSGAYTGELIGYKIVIFYNDGTNEIYMGDL